MRAGWCARWCAPPPTLSRRRGQRAPYRAEVGHVQHGVACQGQPDTLVLAQLVVGLGELLAPLGGGRVHDAEPVEVKAEGGRAAADLPLAAEHREVDDAPPSQLLGRLQDAIFGSLSTLSTPRTVLTAAAVE